MQTTVKSMERETNLQIRKKSKMLKKVLESWKNLTLRGKNKFKMYPKKEKLPFT